MGWMPPSIVFFLTALLSVQSTGDRREVPGEDAQKEATSVIRDLYKTQYSSRNVDDLASLAKTLYQKGVEEKSDSTARYVFLMEAVTIATKARHAEAGLQALNTLAESYTLTPVSLRSKLLEAAAKSARTPGAIAELARAYDYAVVEAIRYDDFDEAGKSASRMSKLARASRNALLSKRSQELVKDVRSLKSEFRRVEKSLNSPGVKDGEAGEYICLVKRRWSEGLERASKGEASAFRSAALLDLAAPLEAAGLHAVGEAWWTIAKKERVSWKKASLLERAGYWYEKALEGATGLTAAKTEKRLVELEALRPGFVNLLRMVEPKRDAVFGNWTREGRDLLTDKTQLSRIEFPYEPPDEYDLRYEFTRREATVDVGVVLAHRGKQFHWVFLGEAVAHGAFALVDNKWINDDANPSRVSVPGGIRTGTRYACEIKVRNEGVKVYLNGALLTDWPTSYANVTFHQDWKLRSSSTLGLTSWDSVTAWHRIELTEISGPGKRIRK